jgi:hypothetical protein
MLAGRLVADIVTLVEDTPATYLYIGDGLGSILT